MSETGYDYNPDNGPGVMLGFLLAAGVAGLIGLLIGGIVGWIARGADKDPVLGPLPRPWRQDGD